MVEMGTVEMGRKGGCSSPGKSVPPQPFCNESGRPGGAGEETGVHLICSRLPPLEIGGLTFLSRFSVCWWTRISRVA